MCCSGQHHGKHPITAGCKICSLAEIPLTCQQWCEPCILKEQELGRREMVKKRLIPAGNIFFAHSNSF